MARPEAEAIVRLIPYLIVSVMTLGCAPSRASVLDGAIPDAPIASGTRSFRRDTVFSSVQRANEAQAERMFTVADDRRRDVFYYPRPVPIEVRAGADKVLDWWAHQDEPFMVFGSTVVRLVSEPEDPWRGMGPVVICESLISGKELWRTALPGPPPWSSRIGSAGPDGYQLARAGQDDQVMEVRSGPFWQFCWRIDIRQGAVIDGPNRIPE